MRHKIYQTWTQADWGLEERKAGLFIGLGKANHVRRSGGGIIWEGCWPHICGQGSRNVQGRCKDVIRCSAMEVIDSVFSLLNGILSCFFGGGTTWPIGSFLFASGSMLSGDCSLLKTVWFLGKSYPGCAWQEVCTKEQREDKEWSYMGQWHGQTQAFKDYFMAKDGELKNQLRGLLKSKAQDSCGL